MENPDKKMRIIKRFIRISSCAHSVLLHSEEFYQLHVDDKLLKGVTGLGGGIAAMGDICGTVNGAIISLGKKFAPLYGNAKEEWKVVYLCHEFFLRIQKETGTCNCGENHGGKEMTRNLRKSLLTGKYFRCFGMLSHGAGILDRQIAGIPNQHDFFSSPRAEAIRNGYEYFQQQQFHCCRSVLQQIDERSGRDLSFLREAVTGFIGGIGFSGTLCGAILGGVLAIGTVHGVNPRARGYKDALKFLYHGFLKSEKIWSDRNLFPGAEAFECSRKIYQMVDSSYGSCDCIAIAGLDIERPETFTKFRNHAGIARCRNLADRVARETLALL
jgi:C_GCAxxG_C_C family probable redox protein